MTSCLHQDEWSGWTRRRGAAELQLAYSASLLLPCLDEDPPAVIQDAARALLVLYPSRRSLKCSRYAPGAWHWTESTTGQSAKARPHAQYCTRKRRLSRRPRLQWVLDFCNVSGVPAAARSETWLVLESSRAQMACGISYSTQTLLYPVPPSLPLFSLF